MAVVADPLWINASAGAPSYSANELRQAMALALMYGGRTLGARAGVRPGGNALQTSIAGATITVRAGVACVDPALTTPQGPYWVCLPSDDTFTLTAAHASLPRKDITVLRVYDHDEDSSGLRKAQAEYITGTAAGSPAEPAVPAGAFRLATIDVPASGGGSPSVTLNFPFAVANGGVIPVRDITQRGLITGYDGLVIERMDRSPRWLEVHDGTAWRVQGVPICTSAADRDGASGVTNPVTGQLVLLTDSTLLTRYTGSAWVFHGRYRDNQTLGADTASVTFSNIPTTLRRVVVNWTARGSKAATICDVRMRINNNSTTGYRSSVGAVTGTTPANFTEDTSTFSTVGHMTAASDGNNIYGGGEVRFTGWDAGGSRPGLNWVYESHTWSSAATAVAGKGGGLFFVAGPYNRIDLFPDTGNFKAGSEFTLYGWE
ncbi:MAG: hypothetical protein ACJ72N_19805 [Labedaea sp.]